MTCTFKLLAAVVGLGPTAMVSKIRGSAGRLLRPVYANLPDQILVLARINLYRQPQLPAGGTKQRINPLGVRHRIGRPSGFSRRSTARSGTENQRAESAL